MTLDDIYAACTAAFNDTDSTAHVARENARKLASYIIALGPVAQAAEDLARVDAPREMLPMANAYRVIEHGRREAALINAVEKMREKLRKR